MPGSRFRETRPSRTQRAVEESLAALCCGAGREQPAAIDFAGGRSARDVGEISGRLKTVFGEYREA